MFYVYELIDPATLKPFYVGKGTGKRAHYHTAQNKKGKFTENIHKDRKIRKILETGVDPIINYPHVNIINEIDAYTLEEELQLFYGLDNLTNICIGSRPPRHIQSESERKERSIRMAGNTHNNGKKRTPEICDMFSRIRSGSGNPNFGKHPDACTRYSIGSAWRGKTRSDTTKEKISSAVGNKYKLVFPDKSESIFTSKELKEYCKLNGHSYDWLSVCRLQHKLFKGISITKLDK